MKVRIYNNQLNPQFWDKTKRLDDSIRIKLLDIAHQFYKESNLTPFLKDVYFLGSSANYNWTPTSDLDLHLIINFEELNMTYLEAKEYVKTIYKTWNERNQPVILGHKVEVYIQDEKELNASTGVYSLVTNTWIKEACPQRIILNKQLIQQKYTNCVNKINYAISTGDLNSMKSVLKWISDMRQSGLDRFGEFSTENIVFKILRQRGVLSQIKNNIQKLS